MLSGSTCTEEEWSVFDATGSAGMTDGTVVAVPLGRSLTWQKCLLRFNTWDSLVRFSDTYFAGNA